MKAPDRLFMPPTKIMMMSFAESSQSNRFGSMNMMLKANKAPAVGADRGRKE